MARLMLNREQWSTLRKIMRDHGVYDKPNLRMMVEGMLYRMRVGCPWRDLPSEFGVWNSIYQKFNRWSEKINCSKYSNHWFKTQTANGNVWMAVL